MAKRIYVGNLSFQITEEELRDLFTEAGNVESIQIITDRNTGRPKGFAFVEMSADAAQKAIAQFNGRQLRGRTLSVKEAGTCQ
jgi:cold-inducible RNA-binding protein